MKVLNNTNLLNNDLTNAKKIGFNTTNSEQDLNVGEMCYNAETEKFDIQLLESVKSSLFEELFFTVKAVGTITKGDIVVFAGAVGGQLLATRAENSATLSPDFIMGVAKHNIADEASGKITAFGVVSGIDTNQFNLANDETQVLLYLSTTAGKLTNVQPEAPFIKSTMAAVTKFDSSAGRIVVRPNLGTRINELHDVQLTNPQNYDTIVRVESSGRYENRPQHEFNSPFIKLNTNTVAEEPEVIDNGVHLKRTMSQETKIQWDENTDRWTIDGTKITKEGDLIDGGSW
jgi:hypothetical protein